MVAKLFKIECLTNLHVGSGDVNFSIIDKEVQKDPVTKYPVIFASGVKGAFRADYSGNNEDSIFGKSGKENCDGSGKYKFFDAKFLSRPLRVGGNPTVAYVPVTTVAAINDFVDTCNAFNCNTLGISKISDQTIVNNHDFVVFGKDIKNIEGSYSVKREDNILAPYRELLGDCFAIAKDINEYDLPVIARNVLDNGVSKNLWYEEFVPHHSMFYLIVLTPDNNFEINIDNYVQFGGNASVGYGYCKVTEIKKEN